MVIHAHFPTQIIALSQPEVLSPLSLTSPSAITCSTNQWACLWSSLICGCMWQRCDWFFRCAAGSGFCANKITWLYQAPTLIILNVLVFTKLLEDLKRHLNLLYCTFPVPSSFIWHCIVLGWPWKLTTWSLCSLHSAQGDQTTSLREWRSLLLSHCSFACANKTIYASV